VANSSLNRLWKNEYLQTVVMILVIVAIVFGFWFGTRLVLNTDYPMLAVASGSMHMPPHTYCDGWSHPFAMTLHVGDLIIVQGVKPEDIYAAPLNLSGRSGDIIVFKDSYSDTLIVHRAVDKRVDSNGLLEIKQEGDGNGVGTGSWINSNLIIGRVVMRVPWIGHLALYMRNSTGILLIVALIIILIVVEFVLPLITGKKTEIGPDEHVEKMSETENPP
jgi:signal peptidase I